MGRIVNDIVDEVIDENIKLDSKKSKNLIKLIITISVTLIGLAFTIGQFRSTIVNRMDNIQTTIRSQTTSIGNLETKINSGFENVDNRIDKVYSDGLKAFDDYQQFNKEQLILVLDYGQENKELLKRMLELNSNKNRTEVENNLEMAKNEVVGTNYDGKIVAVPIKSKIPDYIKIDTYVNNAGDTTFYVTGATLEYINDIDKNKYVIDEFNKSEKYADVYDVTYHNK